jgi:hypothetical protein
MRVEPARMRVKSSQMCVEPIPAVWYGYNAAQSVDLTRIQTAGMCL